MTILFFHLAYYEGKGTKLGEGERDLEGERGIFGIITFGIITIFGIQDSYIRDCFIWEKFVAPWGIEIT